MRLLAGSLALTGTLTSLKIILLALVGSLTPVGAITRTTQKIILGALAPAGFLLKFVARRLSGAISSVGALLTNLVGGITIKVTVTVSDGALIQCTASDSAVIICSVSDDLGG